MSCKLDNIIEKNVDLTCHLYFNGWIGFLKYSDHDIIFYLILGRWYDLVLLSYSDGYLFLEYLSIPI